jgi:hypothetical protein
MTNAEAIRTLKLMQAQIEWDYPMEYSAAIDEAIKALEAQEWIPVSERLPEEDHWLGGSGKQFSDNVLTSITNREDEDAWSDISQTIDGEWALELPKHCEITAWKPLPEPYEAESEEV